MSSAAASDTARNQIVVTLSQAIETIEGEVTKVLILRKPTAADFMRLTAMPVEINLAAEEITPKFNPQVMTDFLARLAGQPPTIIGRLHPSDWVKAAWEVAPFFVPGMPTSS